MDETFRADLVRQLSAAAAECWGLERARELTEAIAATADTLALVAAAHLDHDDLEPDPGIPIARPGFGS
jgi:hypothetical protein